jgi:hypothetical protein
MNERVWVRVAPTCTGAYNQVKKLTEWQTQPYGVFKSLEGDELHNPSNTTAV